MLRNVTKHKTACRVLWPGAPGVATRDIARRRRRGPKGLIDLAAAYPINETRRRRGLFESFTPGASSDVMNGVSSNSSSITRAAP